MSKSKISVENLKRSVILADGTRIGGGSPPHELCWAEVIYGALGASHPDDRGLAPDALEQRAELAETVLKTETDLELSPERLVMIRKHVAYAYSPVVLRRLSGVVESV